MTGIIKAVIAPVKKFFTTFLSFLLARPRIDVNIIPREDDLYGQKVLNVANKQDYETPAIPDVKWDFQFFWNYKIIIKNNSSKTAYNIKIEKIYKGKDDYIEKFEDTSSLKEGEHLELDYIIRMSKTFNSYEADAFRVRFPPFITQIEVIVSYTNEARIRFYTKFTMNANSKENAHLILKPKT